MAQVVERENLVQKIGATMAKANAPEDMVVGFRDQPEEMPNRLKTANIPNKQIVTIFKQDGARWPHKEVIGQRFNAVGIGASQQLRKMLHQHRGRGDFLRDGVVGHRMVGKKTLLCHVQQGTFANPTVTIDNKRRFTLVLPALNSRVDVHELFVKPDEQLLIFQAGKGKIPEIIGRQPRLKDAVKPCLIEDTQQFAGWGFEHPQPLQYRDQGAGDEGQAISAQSLEGSPKSY